MISGISILYKFFVLFQVFLSNTTDNILSNDYFYFDYSRLFVHTYMVSSDKK